MVSFTSGGVHSRITEAIKRSSRSKMLPDRSSPWPRGRPFLAGSQSLFEIARPAGVLETRPSFQLPGITKSIRPRGT